MSTPPVSDEKAIEAVELVRQLGSQVAAADHLRIARSTLQNRLIRAAQRGLDGSTPHPMPEGFEVSRHAFSYDAEGKLKAQSVTAKPSASETWSVPDGHRVKGYSALVDAAGRTVQQWVKTKEGELDPLWVAEKIKEVFADLQARAPLAEAPADADEDLATVIPIADPHFGLYAYAREAGENYDLKIADRTNRAALSRLMASTPASGTAVVLGLGDLVHADNSSNQTARSGNALDVDTRYSLVLQTAVLFMIHAVDLAREKHQRVIVRNLPGNHDDHTALAITTALWAWFRDDPRVTIDDDPSRFWWWRFGATFVGATHGDTVKMKDLPIVMAASRPEDWGASVHRYLLTGHIHHASSLETGGVIVESFQSTAARDAWHQAAGYRSGRSLSALTYHRQHGEISRQKVNIV